MNDAQSETDAQGDGADHRTPNEVALMHLSKQRKHQQPRSSDRNQNTRVAIANLSRSPIRAQGESAEVHQPQSPLQCETKIQKSKMNRAQWILQGPAKLGEKRWKIVTRADDEVGVVLASIEKTDSQPREASTNKGANHKRGTSNGSDDPRASVSPFPSQKQQRADTGDSSKCQPGLRCAQEPRRCDHGRRCDESDKHTERAVPSFLPQRPENKKRCHKQQLPLEHCARGQQTTA